MKHLLNNLSNEEKNNIRKQHTGGMKVMTENFNRLLKASLGNSKPLVEQRQEETEGFFDNVFGKPTVDRATKDSYKSQGHSHRGKDDEEYTMFDGKKYYSDDIIYADYNDMGKIPRVEDGKLIVTNPAWEL